MAPLDRQINRITAAKRTPLRRAGADRAIPARVLPQQAGPQSELLCACFGGGKVMADDTQSLCPRCLATVPAKRRTSGKDVFVDKICPTHGPSTVRIAKDAQRFFDKTFDVAGKPFTPVTKFHGHCGEDCGWCDGHRQHVCTGLIEVTDCCDLACPVCYFGAKGKHHLSRQEFHARLDTLLQIENGKLEILQISGGECLTHPDFCGLLDEALAHDIGRIVINTNGLGFLRNDAAFEKVRANRDRVEVYLQFDGFSDSVYEQLRGRALLAEKRTILAKLDAAAIKICLAVTVFEGNRDQIGDILKLATETAHISGVTFQRLTKVGSATKADLRSVFQEDILLAIAASGMMAYKHMVPLPCSHENCTSLGFLFCSDGKVFSLGDYIDLARHKTIISNRLAFDKTILDAMRREVCDCFAGGKALLAKLLEFSRGGASRHKDMKIVRILVKNFMDADNFDVERLKKCCTGVAAGDGKVIPFCMHNALKEKVPWKSRSRKIPKTAASSDSS
jgi:7,8-dihydro-6-hydroxymethylpterin dimethyltransferase